MARITNFLIVSNSEKDKALEENICSSNKLYNINNAISFDNWKLLGSNSRIKIRYGIDSRFVVGSIGRLTKQKNWKMFIQAANEVLKLRRDVTFIVCGEGELRSQLEELTHKLRIQDKVIFLGYLKDVNPIFKIIDVYVNTSDWEGLPYTILEALHHKKPLVATDTGNFELIRDEISSYVVPRRDYKSFGNRICTLLEEHHKRESFAENGNKLVNSYKYSLIRFINEHKKIYISVLE